MMFDFSPNPYCQAQAADFALFYSFTRTIQFKLCLQSKSFVQEILLLSNVSLFTIHKPLLTLFIDSRSEGNE